jgi:hypothetical protein
VSHKGDKEEIFYYSLTSTWGCSTEVVKKGGSNRILDTSDLGLRACTSAVQLGIHRRKKKYGNSKRQRRLLMTMAVSGR